MTNTKDVWNFAAGVTFVLFIFFLCPSYT